MFPAGRQGTLGGSHTTILLALRTRHGRVGMCRVPIGNIIPAHIEFVFALQANPVRPIREILRLSLIVTTTLHEKDSRHYRDNRQDGLNSIVHLSLVGQIVVIPSFAHVLVLRNEIHLPIIFGVTVHQQDV